MNATEAGSRSRAAGSTFLILGDLLAEGKVTLRNVGGDGDDRVVDVEIYTSAFIERLCATVGHLSDELEARTERYDNYVLAQTAAMEGISTQLEVIQDEVVLLGERVGMNTEAIGAVVDAQDRVKRLLAAAGECARAVGDVPPVALPARLRRQ